MLARREPPCRRAESAVRRPPQRRARTRRRRASGRSRFEGESCAICKASASMMTAAVKGKSRGGRRAAHPANSATWRPASSTPHERASPRPAHGVRRRARPADAREMRDPAVAHAARRVQFGRARTSTEADDDPMHEPAPGGVAEPRVDLKCRRSPKSKPTPNPNARKFVLKEPLTWGITRSYDNAAQAQDDPLAAALFDIEHVTNVFYVDHWITVTQDGRPTGRSCCASSRCRSAKRRRPTTQSAARSRRRRLPRDRADERSGPERLDKINEMLDEQVRPYLQGDGGDLYVLGLEGNQLTVHYQGACGSCPSSLSGTLAGHRKPGAPDRARHRSRRGLSVSDWVDRSPATMGDGSASRRACAGRVARRRRRRHADRRVQPRRRATTRSRTCARTTAASSPAGTSKATRSSARATARASASAPAKR